jgi:hypothetical protein
VSTIERILEWLESRKLVVEHSPADQAGKHRISYSFEPVVPTIPISEADARDWKEIIARINGGFEGQLIHPDKPGGWSEIAEAVCKDWAALQRERELALEAERRGGMIDANQVIPEEPAAAVVQEEAKAEETPAAPDSSGKGSHPAGLPATTIVPTVPLTPAVQALMNKVAKPTKDENGEPVKKVRASRKKNGIALVEKETPPAEQAAAASAGNSFDNQVNKIVAAQPSIDTGGEDRLRTELQEQGIRVFSQPEPGIDPFAEPPAAKPPQPIDEEGLDNSPF